MKFDRKLTDWVASRRSANTRSAYLRDVHMWLDFCAKRKASAVKPAPKTVVAFRDELLKDRAPLSVRRTLACLSAAYSAIAPTMANPFSERAMPRPSASTYSRTEAAADEDVRAMLNVSADKPRDFAMLWLLWATGMRRVSAVSIRRDGMRRDAGRLMLRFTDKGGGEEETEVPQDAATAIDAWLKVAPDSKWLFCTKSGARLSPQAVTKIVSVIAKEACVKVHPHMFRAAVATTLLDANVPLEQARAFLRHKDPRTTLRYDRGHRAAGVADRLAAYRNGGR